MSTSTDEGPALCAVTKLPLKDRAYVTYPCGHRVVGQYVHMRLGVCPVCTRAVPVMTGAAHYDALTRIPEHLPAVLPCYKQAAPGRGADAGTGASAPSTAPGILASLFSRSAAVAAPETRLTVTELLHRREYIALRDAHITVHDLVAARVQLRDWFAAGFTFRQLGALPGFGPQTFLDLRPDLSTLITTQSTRSVFSVDDLADAGIRLAPDLLPIVCTMADLAQLGWFPADIARMLPEQFGPEGAYAFFKIHYGLVPSDFSRFRVAASEWHHAMPFADRALVFGGMSDAEIADATRWPLADVRRVVPRE